MPRIQCCDRWPAKERDWVKGPAAAAGSSSSFAEYETLTACEFVAAQDFERLAGGFFAKAAAPLATLLQRNPEAAKNISAVELLGGGTRVPRLQAALSEALGGRALDK